MLGGRREPYDPRPALAILEQGGDTASALDELWDGLHHQGDVDEASYAAVPHLVRIHKLKPLPDWHVYALLAVIEESRLTRVNPDIPPHLRDSYDRALKELAADGVGALQSTEDRLVITSIIALIALAKGRVALGSFALMTEDEQRELLQR